MEDRKDAGLIDAHTYDRHSNRGDHENGTPTSQTVLKTLKLLDVFDNTHPTLTSRQVASLVGIPFSTAYRMLVTLVEAGLLEYDAKNREYSLGIKHLRYASFVLRNLDIRRVSRPAIEWLSALTGETVHVGIPKGTIGVFIDQVESVHSLRIHARVGEQIPLSVGATMLTILAFQDQALVDAVISSGLKRYGPNSIVDPVRLNNRLEQIRKDGWAMSFEELNPGTMAVAAPIRNHEGKVVASVAMAAPTSRVGPQDAIQVSSLVKEAAGKISARLGYSPTECTA